MDYHDFLTYLFDRAQTRELAVELGVAVDEVLVPRTRGRTTRRLTRSRSESKTPAPRWEWQDRHDDADADATRRLVCRPLAGRELALVGRRSMDRLHRPATRRAPGPTTPPTGSRRRRSESTRSAPAGSPSVVRSPASWDRWSSTTCSCDSLGVEKHSPLLTLAVQFGLWMPLVTVCVVAVRRHGTGSLRDLGFTARWIDLPLGLGFAVASLIGVGNIATGAQVGRDRTSSREPHGTVAPEHPDHHRDRLHRGRRRTDRRGVVLSGAAA